MKSVATDEHPCYVCKRATTTHCPLSGLAFCGAVHMQQHWDANPWLYTLQGHRNKRREKEERKKKKKKEKKPRVRGPGDKASVVARAISQMPEGTMTEREAIHLNELKLRFDNARDAHRKALKREALNPTMDPGLLQIRAEAALARMEDIRNKRQAAVIEFERLYNQLEHRKVQAILGIEYVLQEQLRFEERSSDAQLDAWVMPPPKPVVPIITVDNSEPSQTTIVIEEEEPTTRASSTAEVNEFDADLQRKMAQVAGPIELEDAVVVLKRSTPSATSSSTSSTSSSSSEEEEASGVEVEGDDEETSSTETSSSQSESDYDAFVLYPDGRFKFNRHDPGIDNSMQRLELSDKRPVLPGTAYYMPGEGSMDLNGWTSFLVDMYGVKQQTLYGGVFIYPHNDEHFTSDDRRYIRSTLKEYSSKLLGTEQSKLPVVASTVVFHMDGTYELAYMTQEELDTERFPTNEMVLRGKGRIISYGSGQRRSASQGVNPWSTFLYEKLRWDGVVYDAPIMYVKLDQYARPVDVLTDDAFMDAVARKAKELVKLHRPTKS